MKIVTSILLKANCARTRLRNAFTKGKSGPLSPLAVVGLLSALLLGITCGREILNIYQLHKSQTFIVYILELVLSGWAIAEASSKQARQLKIQLARLKLALYLQLSFIALCTIKAFSQPQLEADNAAVSNLYLSLIFAGIQFLIFVYISIELINAFTFNERQRAKQLENARLELKNKLRSSLMASGIAHEINQPLSTLLLSIELTRSEAYTATPEISMIQKRLSEMASESQRIVSTIATMRSLLRVVQTNHTIVDLENVIKTTATQEKNSLASVHTCVAISRSANNFKILGDAGQIRITITNLLRNAGEALRTTDGVNSQIEISLSHYENQICVQVADNGPGFPEAIREATQLKTTKPQGSGIGLYLASLTMENHSGSLILGVSKKLGGAEVRMLFPSLDS
jgi:signal transduction histidine kinase